MAIWVVPLHRFPFTVWPHLLFANCMEWPGVLQFVQDVTGLGRFMRRVYHALVFCYAAVRCCQLLNLSVLFSLISAFTHRLASQTISRAA